MKVEELENTYIDDLNILDDWILQYEYLIQIASDMPRLPREKRRDENKVKGCQSGVWLDLSIENGKIRVNGDSNAMIIRGILSIIVNLLNDRTPEEIVSYQPRFISETNIKKQISTDRFHGIYSVIKTIQNYAQEFCKEKKLQPVPDEKD